MRATPTAPAVPLPSAHERVVATNPAIFEAINKRQRTYAEVRATGAPPPTAARAAGVPPSEADAFIRECEASAYVSRAVFLFAGAADEVACDDASIMQILHNAAMTAETSGDYTAVAAAMVKLRQLRVSEGALALRAASHRSVSAPSRGSVLSAEYNLAGTSDEDLARASSLAIDPDKMVTF